MSAAESRASDPLATLIEMGERATPGRWTAEILTVKNNPRVGGSSTFAEVRAPEESEFVLSVAMCAGNVANAEYIAACSPAVLLPLLRELSERRKAAHVRETCDYDCHTEGEGCRHPDTCYPWLAARSPGDSPT